MTNSRFLSLILILCLINCISVIQAQNWPCWRGPNGDGTSIEKNLPARWDSITNVVWKIAVPGMGYSSPLSGKISFSLLQHLMKLWRKSCFVMILKKEIFYGKKPFLNPNSKISTIITAMPRGHPQQTGPGLCLVPGW